MLYSMVKPEVHSVQRNYVAIGWKKINIGEIYFEGMVKKYSVNLYLNKTICTYIIIILLLKHLKNSVLEAIGSKRYSTKLLHECN